MFPSEAIPGRVSETGVQRLTEISRNVRFSREMAEREEISKIASRRGCNILVGHVRDTSAVSLNEDRALERSIDPPEISCRKKRIRESQRTRRQKDWIVV